MGIACGIAGVLLAVLLLVGYVLMRSPHYKTLFSDEHLLEFMTAVAGLKTKALADIEDAAEPRTPTPDDSRVAFTSGELMVVYTITRDGAEYEHHYSLRDRQGYTASTVGRMFTALAAIVLGIDPRSMRIERSENHVYHAEFTLDEAQKLAFVARPVREGSPEGLPALRAEVRESADLLEVQDVTVGMPFVR